MMPANMTAFSGAPGALARGHEHRTRAPTSGKLARRAGRDLFGGHMRYLKLTLG